MHCVAGLAGCGGQPTLCVWSWSQQQTVCLSRCEIECWTNGRQRNDHRQLLVSVNTGHLHVREPHAHVACHILQQPARVILPHFPQQVHVFTVLLHRYCSVLRRKWWTSTRHSWHNAMCPALRKSSASTACPQLCQRASCRRCVYGAARIAGNGACTASVV